MESKNNNIIQFLKYIAGQKFTWFASLTLTLVITAFSTRPDDDITAKNSESQLEAISATQHSAKLEEVALESGVDNHTDLLPEATAIPAELPIKSNSAAVVSKKKPTSGAEAEKLISYAQSLLGQPYQYGGTTPSGFDCSGFVYHVFSKYDIDIERSSRAQSTQGVEVKPEKVVPGDLLFFTGTNPKIREVGHVGIVISEPGAPVTFVHSSSNGGVKISELEGYYTTRFMFAKRVQ